MQLLAPERRFRMAMKHGWTRLVTATRPRYRLARRYRDQHTGNGGVANPLAAPSTAPASSSAVDLVALTVLAVNRLGPATLRTVANGKPLTVTVPDARTGEIFRAALAEMQKTRLTDRLIAIVIANEQSDAGRASTGA
jgi:hypothetical protein